MESTIFCFITSSINNRIVQRFCPGGGSLQAIRYLPEYREGDSLYTMYAHLGTDVSDLPGPKTHVGTGTQIGNMGKSGNAGDWIHLHIELRFGNGDSNINAHHPDWYNPDKFVPIDPALIITPNDTFTGWVAQYQCSPTGLPVAEPYLGSQP